MSHDDRYVLQLGDRGRLVLPARLRRQLGLEEGDRLVLTLEDDGSLRLVSTRIVAQRLHGVLCGRVPADRSLVDELIAERREEAAREERALRERSHITG